MDIGEARKQYGRLHDRWIEAHSEAVTARKVCMLKLRAGEVSTEDKWRRAEELEALAESLRNDLDEFVGQYFGD